MYDKTSSLFMSSDAGVNRRKTVEQKSLVSQIFTRLQGHNVQPEDGPAFRVDGRIAYIANHSYPFSSNGYAVRTGGVAGALSFHGHSVVVITKPGMPWDLPQFVDDDYACSHIVGGVRYLHLPYPRNSGKTQSEYLGAAIEAFKRVLRVFKPAVVHAASNWKNALPAAIAAKELGLPFFYEVRGFWEITRASREPEWAHSDEFQQVVKYERAVSCAADRVFTLNRFMRRELVQRGVDPARIELVPNGIEVPRDMACVSRAQQPIAVSRVELGIRSRFVVGFIGSLNQYEGLEDLVRAAAGAYRRGIDISLVLVGSSHATGLAAESAKESVETQLRRVAESCGIAERLVLPGRVEHGAIADYYDLFDLVVLPRRPLPVCELVSPLKPLEALAAGKRVLMSNVAPLAELAEISTRFQYFDKGSVESLTDRLVGLLVQDDRLQPLSADVLTDISWTARVAPISQWVYQYSRMRREGMPRSREWNL